ncbi:hypothetical protein JB92DRAFT_2838412 [Gautieria morchelliformis]|nr:hypothetical protein JB92DRAFT_2838412 [Gautieria morchelliformis]
MKTDPLEGISFHKPSIVGQITDQLGQVDDDVGESDDEVDELDNEVDEFDDEVDEFDNVDNELGPSQSKAATAPLWTTLATAKKHSIGAEHRNDYCKEENSETIYPSAQWTGTGGKQGGAWGRKSKYIGHLV